MHRLITPIMLLVLGLGLAAAAPAVELPAAAKGKDTPVTAAKPETDKGAKDPADFFRPPGLVRTSYSQAAGKNRDEEIATYHASAGMDEVATAFLERLQAAGWKQGADSVSGSGASRVRIIEWTMPAKEAEVRFYAVKGSGCDLRVRVYSYKSSASAKSVEENLSPPPVMIPVPNVVGLALDKAGTNLQTSRLKVRLGAPLQPLPPEATLADEVVGAQSPAAGVAVPVNTEIVLNPKLGTVVVPPLLSGRTFAEAQNTLSANRLKAVHAPVEKETPNELRNGLVAEQSPAAGATVEKLSTVTLTMYKSMIPVPDVVGLALDAASANLKIKRLTVWVSGPSNPLPAEATRADEVVGAQSPAAGVAVPVNTQIVLTPKLGTVVVPDLLSGRTFGQAQSTLSANRLNTVHAPVEKETPNELRNGLVAEQSPAAGTTVDKLSTVTLTTWKAMIPVPDVVGQPASKAEKLLHQAHLRTVIVQGPTTLDKNSVGLISAQSPMAGQSVARDTVVTLTTYTARIQ